MMSDRQKNVQLPTAPWQLGMPSHSSVPPPRAVLHDPWQSQAPLAPRTRGLVLIRALFPLGHTRLLPFAVPL